MIADYKSIPATRLYLQRKEKRNRVRCVSVETVGTYWPFDIFSANVRPTICPRVKVREINFCNRQKRCPVCFSSASSVSKYFPTTLVRGNIYPIYTTLPRNIRRPSFPLLNAISSEKRGREGERDTRSICWNNHELAIPTSSRCES